MPEDHPLRAIREMVTNVRDQAGLSTRNGSNFCAFSVHNSEKSIGFNLFPLRTESSSFRSAGSCSLSSLPSRRGAKTKSSRNFFLKRRYHIRQVEPFARCSECRSLIAWTAAHSGVHQRCHRGHRSDCHRRHRRQQERREPVLVNDVSA